MGEMNETIVVTGGAGFIGSALVRHLIRETNATVVVIDKLTYAGHRSTLEPVAGSRRLHFEKEDVADPAAMQQVFETYRPSAVLHLAAESHVDRSIDGRVSRLRRKLGDSATTPTRIKTVWGKGYLLVPDAWNGSTARKSSWKSTARPGDCPCPGSKRHT